VSGQSRAARWAGAILVLLVVAAASGYAGVRVGRQYTINLMCCQVPPSRNVVLTLREMLGFATFNGEIQQDKWVIETVFPDVTNGYFVDVGSGDGVIGSNTKLLEDKGWTGVCVDPFPKNMEGRTCQMFKEVVFSEAGKRMQFHTAGDLGGIADTLGQWKERAAKAPTVEFATVTMGDLLVRAKAPSFIHFINLDIEGAELEALKGFPFDRYQVGAFAIEHNYEGEKRNAIEALLKTHGYRRTHTWRQDDFFVRE
jgi:FkbM family methyltransferase